jgi:hypothetical protein
MGFPVFTAVGTAVGAYFGGPMGAAAGASIGAGLDGQQGQAEANQANAVYAQDTRNWQYSMSSTAAQRAANDFEAAGFNRLLATGAQASTPQGATATAESTMEPIAHSARDAASSIATREQLKKQGAEIALLNSQRDAADAQALKSTVEAAVTKKGIPEAELKNDFYDIIRPGVKKIKQMMQTNPKKENSRATSVENARKFFKPNYGGKP